MTALPGLHVVTDDAVLAREALRDRAARLLEAHGPAIALHLRGPATSAARLHRLAAALLPAARSAGALLLVNDRVDVALALGVDGVQLGRRSLPATAARELRPEWIIGASVHDADEAARAEDADFLVLGAIWETASHPGRAGAGLGLVRDVRERDPRPVIAIGGMTPERTGDARRAGAAGVAVLSGVWDDPDPARAAGRYLDALRRVDAAGGDGHG